MTTCTLRCLASAPRPPVSLPTTLSCRRASCRGRSAAGCSAPHVFQFGDLVDHLGGVQQGFRRDTADVQTDAAEARVALDQYDLFAEIRRTERRGITARPAPKTTTWARISATWPCLLINPFSRFCVPTGPTAAGDRPDRGYQIGIKAANRPACTATISMLCIARRRPAPVERPAHSHSSNRRMSPRSCARYVVNHAPRHRRSRGGRRKG